MLILKWVAFLINWAALGTWFLSWHVPFFFLPLCESKYLADTKEGCRTKKHFENVSVQLWIEVPYILKGRRRCNGSRRWTAALLGANRCSKRILAFSEYISIFSPLEFYILWRFVFLKYLLVLRFTDCNLVSQYNPNFICLLSRSTHLWNRLQIDFDLKLVSEGPYYVDFQLDFVILGLLHYQRFA